MVGWGLVLVGWGFVEVGWILVLFECFELGGEGVIECFVENGLWEEVFVDFGWFLFEEIDENFVIINEVFKIVEMYCIIIVFKDVCVISLFLCNLYVMLVCILCGFMFWILLEYSVFNYC